MKGGAGSGKSVFATQKLIYRTLTEQHPTKKHKFLVVRKVAKTLRESCFDQIRATIADWNMEKLFYKPNKTNMSFQCKNGNSIISSGLDDVEKIKSITGITGVWVEEASELEARDLRQLNLRLRGWTPYYKQFLLTFNPVSFSNYLRQEFFTVAREDTTTHNSTYKDNKFIDAEYKQQLESYAELDPYYYQVYVLNEWGSAEGAVFPEFRNAPNAARVRTHVIAPFEPPKEWKIYRSYDFGYSKPFSIGWWAQDHDGRLYRILELYGCTGEPNTGVKWTPEKTAERIREIEESHLYLKGKQIIGVADPSIWDASRGDSIAAVMEKYRIYFEKGDNKRIAGKMQVHYRLQFDTNGIPMLYVFDTCKDFIRTIPELIYSTTNPEDVDTNQEDHIYDETRYICQMNPIAPKRNIPAKATKYNPLEEEASRDPYGFIRL
ncbi:MAG: PBSX family phage terminase large subunit [Ruminococcaceae bacterium]|nr:PBSX family phage terminase large subunit [Oscillospiraceae bacterium]